MIPLLVLLLACAGGREQAIEACMAACEAADPDTLADGPCLDEAVAADWVCDVAHDPRADVDDEPANQCGRYRAGEARHFVEVDADCGLIRAR